MHVGNPAPAPVNGYKKAPVYVIEEGAYRLSIGKDSSEGSALVSGRIVEGMPGPIPIFGKELIVGDVRKMTGGRLLVGPGDDRRIFFLPSGRDAFQIELSFVVPTREDETARVLAFDIPPALRTSLVLELKPGLRLMETPGVPEGNGVYRLPVSRSMVVRFAPIEDSVVEVDSFSRIRVQEQKLILTTAFVRTGNSGKPLILQAPEGARYVPSSTSGLWVKKTEGNGYQLDLSRDIKQPFSVQFVLDAPGPDGGFSFILPQIQDNKGKEGAFLVEEIDDGQLTVTAPELVQDMPVSRLRAEFVNEAGKNRYMQVPPGSRIDLAIRRFRSLHASPVVLDTLSFFTSFEENGAALSVLQMDVPPEVGPHLKLRSIPGAEIWALTVNGNKRKVYANGDDTWIIPLEGNGVSHVELSFIGKGPKLELRGRLETSLPPTELPTRNLVVGLALPERVELVSVEGPVAAAQNGPGKVPGEFVGRPYFFSRAFYKGEGMKVAVAYREPVREEVNNNEGGAK
jgi:hypothetical protein